LDARPIFIGGTVDDFKRQYTSTGQVFFVYKHLINGRAYGAKALHYKGEGVPPAQLIEIPGALYDEPPVPLYDKKVESLRLEVEDKRDELHKLEQELSIIKAWINLLKDDSDG
jgi:hypothetical protein